MKRIITILSICLFFFGCTTSAIFNIKNENFSSLDSGQQPSIESIEKSILNAAKSRGWSVRIIEPGMIEASILVRTHRASIKIPYTRANYSILYLDSSNLHYNGKSIHKRYNDWIVKLNKSIQKEINQLR